MRRYGFIGLLLVLVGLNSVTPWAQQSAPLPDLIVTQITVAPEVPKPLEIVTVSVKVKNVGQAPAGAFRVSFTVTSTLTKRVEGLDVNEEATVLFSWFGPEGAHTLKAEVNPFGDVEEASRDNNSLERAVEVKPELLPDLVIQSVTLTPPYPTPGETVSVEVVIGNAGTLAPSARPALRLRDDLSTLATKFSELLAPGEQQTFTIQWTPQAGERRLLVELDALERVRESNEDNNRFSQIVTVSTVSFTGANLVVEAVEVSPANALPGELVTLTAVVLNGGQGSVEQVSIQFEADGSTVGEVTIEHLEAGESRQVSVSWTASEVGERMIRVKADAQGNIPELEEADNVLVQFAEVGESLNACGQQVWLRLEEPAAQLLADTLLLTIEEVQHELMSRVKLAIEADYAGINIRFALNRPQGIHSQLRFTADPPPASSVLGEAPLDFNNFNKADVGRVYVTGFESGLARGQAFNRDLDSLAQAVAKVSSHEAGHFLGLGHDDEATTRRFGGQNLMAPSVETQTSSLFADSFFTEENLAYLRSILPLTCDR